MTGDCEQRGAPRVTVAIPTRNRAAMLEVALRSVLAQELVDFEVIVSDNASTDRTAMVVAAFDDPRIAYTRLPEDAGLHVNLTRCLTLGSAPYVTILQDDDYVLPGHLAAKVALLDAHPSVGVVHSRFHYVDEQGRTLRPDVDWTGDWGEPIEPGPVFIERSLQQLCRINLTSAVMRRSCVRGHAFDPDDGVQADVGFWLRVALTCDIAFIDETHTVRRLHAGALSVRRRHLAPGSAGGTATLPLLASVASVHERFVNGHGGLLGPALDPLWRANRSFRRRRALELIRSGADDTPAGASLRALRHAVAAHPALVGDVRTYWCLATILAGRRGRRLWRRGTGRSRR